eukprot:Pompholyxophrys_punicea_v1_NODE_51_length_4304_cov_7.342359.p3 type:complete len:100 gc:universal NODE_51_length_4304_cov_7.342359:2413-2712(+)
MRVVDVLVTRVGLLIRLFRRCMSIISIKGWSILILFRSTFRSPIKYKWSVLLNRSRKSDSEFTKVVTLLFGGLYTSSNEASKFGSLISSDSHSSMLGAV